MTDSPEQIPEFLAAKWQKEDKEIITEDSLDYISSEDLVVFLRDLVDKRVSELMLYELINGTTPPHQEKT